MEQNHSSLHVHGTYYVHLIKLCCHQTADCICSLFHTFSLILPESNHDGLDVIYSRHWLVLNAFHQGYNCMHIKAFSLVHAVA